MGKNICISIRLLFWLFLSYLATYISLAFSLYILHSYFSVYFPFSFLTVHSSIFPPFLFGYLTILSDLIESFRPYEFLLYFSLFLSVVEMKCALRLIPLLGGLCRWLAWTRGTDSSLWYPTDLWSVLPALSLTCNNMTKQAKMLPEHLLHIHKRLSSLNKKL